MAIKFAQLYQYGHRLVNHTYLDDVEQVFVSYHIIWQIGARTFLLIIYFFFFYAILFPTSFLISFYNISLKLLVGLWREGYNRCGCVSGGVWQELRLTSRDTYPHAEQVMWGQSSMLIDNDSGSPAYPAYLSTPYHSLSSISSSLLTPL